MPSQLSDHQEEAIHRTYFALRYGMVTLALALYIGVVFQWLAFGCSQGSISAYYFTPVRPVLIATLSAIGVGLIIYRGNGQYQNSILDVAGFLAIVVAFVPTSTPTAGTGCNPTDTFLSPEISSKIPPAVIPEIATAYANKLDDGIMIALANSVATLALTSLIVFLIGTVALRFVPLVIRPKFDKDTKRLTITGSAIAALFVIGALFFLLSERSTFRYWAHPVAAILFFALVLLVALLNGLDKETRKSYRPLYRGIVLAAVVLILALYVIHLGAPFAWIFWVETVGVAAFIAFWLLQSWELQGYVDREAANSVAQADSAQPASSGEPH